MAAQDVPGDDQMEALAGDADRFGRDMELRVFDAVRAGAPGPVAPVKLAPNDSFAFRCHRGIACWNACCSGADVTLTPYDILRISRGLHLRPAELLERYTVPAVHEPSDMPIAKLKMGGDDGKGPCPFVAAEGCTVYADRPATCRYYPLGLVSVKHKDGAGKEDFHFLVREPHCRGHAEAKMQTVAEFRREQEIEPYERANRGWIDILMKLASWRSVGGPMGTVPSPQARQMFFMVSTDVQRLRRFILGSRFLAIYDIPTETVRRIEADDVELLRLGFDWLKNVLFNEPTLAMRPEALQGAIARARAELGGT